MRFRFGRHELDLHRYELCRDGTAVPVEPQVFDVLAHLLTHADRVVTKEELLDEVWGDRFVSESALTSRIKAARRAVGDDGTAQQVIRTVHGRGYRFVADHEVLDPSTDDLASDAATDPTAATETRYATGRGASIAYQVLGDGAGATDLVFVPGFVSSVELQWELEPVAAFFRRLATRRRVIVFDKRGTGLSDRIAPGEVPTLEERIEDLVAVMAAAGSERADLFGISEGGAMALLFAATHPHRVRRLVLYGTYPRLDFVDPPSFERFLERIRDRWGRGSVVGKLLAPSWANDPEVRRIAARFERHAASPATAAQILSLSSAVDVTDVLASVSCPTLVVHRDRDAFVPPRAGRAIAEGVRGARYLELPGADHLAFAGDGDALLDAVEEFLAAAPPESERGTVERGTADRVLASMVVVAAGSDTSVTAPADAAVADEIPRLGGELVGRIDGRTVAVFPGPARAVLAGCRLAEVAGPGARAGVHTAEIERNAAGVSGVGVQICASIADLAQPGEVWVSRTVRDLVAGSGLRFESRGDRTLPGTGEAWSLHAVVRGDGEAPAPRSG